jgi:dephospho-CoA kinase
LGWEINRVNKPFVLGFGGHMGSGKSTLAQALASSLGCPLSSFGDVVRDEAEARGVPGTRENLQSIGQELVEKQLVEFCEAVIEKAGAWHRSGLLVIDGLRHSEVVETVRGLVKPVPMYLILVDLPDDERRARLSVREPDVALHPEYELHPTEKSVEDLREIADLVLRGNDLKQTGVDSVLQWLAKIDGGQQ